MKKRYLLLLSLLIIIALTVGCAGGEGPAPLTEETLAAAPAEPTARPTSAPESGEGPAPLTEEAIEPTKEAMEAGPAEPTAQPTSPPESVSPVGPGSLELGGDDLLAQLRNGGLIIVIRHAATDRSQPDDEEVDLDDCSTQRNLTDEGRADARTIGEAFLELRIPVGTIWASPYCRARETANLAFGRYEVIDGLERLFPVTDEVADSRIN